MNTVDTQADDELRDLYRELILDHARSPRHFGRLSSATHAAQGINMLCGDKLHLYLQLDSEQRITDASFEGFGCAISVASASLLTDTVIGMPAPIALETCTVITERLTSETSGQVPDSDLGKLSALLGVREFPARVKCATLAWHALDSAIHNKATPVATE